MSRLPEPPDVAPADYLQATRERSDALAELIDQVSVDAGLPAIANALTLDLGETTKLIELACQPPSIGVEVVPHLLSSMDALAAELRTLLERLARA